MFLRRMVVISLIAVLFIGGTILIYMFAIRDNTRWSLIAVGGGHQVSEFSNSRMHLFRNGTFTVEIIQGETPILSGVGTWLREGGTYVFSYTDKWIRSGGNMVGIGSQIEIYNRVGQRIQFTAHNIGITFYFR